MRIALVLVLLALIDPLRLGGAQADTVSLFRDMQPRQVVEITLQFDDSVDYHEFVYMDGQSGVCDLSRPPQARRCQFDLSALAWEFREIEIVKHVAEVPDSVNWEGWDWDTMALKPGGYTPVALAAEIREWNPDTGRARRWWLACSLLPDMPNLAVCQETDQIEDGPDAAAFQLNYGYNRRFTIVRADGLLAIREALDQAASNAPADDSATDMGSIMEDIYSNG
jgi:hypothetical protein